MSGRLGIDIDDLFIGAPQLGERLHVMGDHEHAGQSGIVVERSKTNSDPIKLVLEFDDGQSPARGVIPFDMCEEVA